MVVEERNGIRITHRGERDAGVLREVFDEDAYRVAQIPKGSVVLDLGAHVGAFALRCAVERRCIVLAAEPYPPSFGYLCGNVHANAEGGGVVAPRWAAVGGSRGLRQFYPTPSHPAGSSLYEHPEGRSIAPVKVPCFSLDELVLLSLGKPITVKMDVEGAEREVFADRGALAWALRSVDRVLMEWHNHDGYVYGEALEALGFEVELRGGGVPQPVYDRSIGGGLLYAQRKAG